MAAAHLIEVAGQVEGEHDLLARALGVIVDHAHNRFDPPLERTVRPVRLQFVVLDEVDAGPAELADQRRRFLGTEADARLDDRADQRSSVDTGKPPRSSNAKPRSRIGRAQILAAGGCRAAANR